MKHHIAIYILFAATLAAEAVPVRIVKPNFGTVVAADGQGNQYPASDTPYDIPEGTRLTFIQTPKSECSVFAEWQCVGGEMSGDRLEVGSVPLTIYARFQIVQYTIEAQVFPADAGRARVRCGVGDIFLDVAGSVNCGSTLQLIVSEDETTGFKFEQWDDGVTDRVRLVPADGDRVYVAHFSNPQQTTGLKSIPNGAAAKKYIEDGALRIRRTGQVYNAQGLLLTIENTDNKKQNNK